MCNLNNKKKWKQKIFFFWYQNRSANLFSFELAPKISFSHLHLSRAKVSQERRAQFSQFSSAGTFFYYFSPWHVFYFSLFIPELRWFLWASFSVFIRRLHVFHCSREAGEASLSYLIEELKFRAQLLALDAVIYVCFEVKPIIAIKFVIKYEDSLSAHNAAMLLQKIVISIVGKFVHHFHSTKRNWGKWEKYDIFLLA